MMTKPIYKEGNWQMEPDSQMLHSHPSIFDLSLLYLAQGCWRLSRLTGAHPEQLSGSLEHQHIESSSPKQLGMCFIGFCYRSNLQNRLHTVRNEVLAWLTCVSKLMPLQLVWAGESATTFCDITLVRLLSCEKNKKEAHLIELNPDIPTVCAIFMHLLISPVCLRPCICRWDSLKYFLLHPG